MGSVLVGVNLKLYFDHETTLEWSRQIADLARRHPAVTGGLVELFVVPSLPSIPAVLDTVGSAGVGVGAQDLFWEDSGAYTGAVSGVSLAQLGCGYVAVGHEERRRLFGDDDRVVSRKLAAALRTGLTPVLCVGEAGRLSGEEAAEHCVGQLDAALTAPALAGLGGPVVVAYEPVWAIGAERAAAPDHIVRVSAALREGLAASPVATTARVIYGGSAGPGLLPQLGTAVDGLFLGRFAHDTAALERVLDETLAVARLIDSGRLLQ